MIRNRHALAMALALASPAALAGHFVYEGRLDDLGQPANGRYDLKLTAYGDPKLGATLAAPITFEGVEVRDGRFRLDVELPLVNSDDVWLEVAVRATGEPVFASIPGRSKAIAAPLIGACWSTTGDSGSNPATNFLGTTDNQPLVLRTANARSLRIEPSSFTFGSPALPITTNTIGGSHANEVTPGVRGATIAGGGVPAGSSDPFFQDNNPNRVTDHYGTVGGGFANQAGDNAGLTFDRPFATVGGGRRNTAGGLHSTVAGGGGNIASGEASTVAGGGSNIASGDFSTVIGGAENTASGSVSTVAGGSANCAGGTNSWAGGFRAKVRPATEPVVTTCAGLASYPGGTGDQGTFVWADSQNADFVSTGSNQFLVRAQGGMAINTNTPAAGASLTVNGATSLGGNVGVSPSGSLSFGSQIRQMINLWGPAEYGIGVQNSAQYFRVASVGAFAWFAGGSHNDAQFNPGPGGSLLMTLTSGASTSTPTGVARAQSFVNVSDRAAKTAFESIDVGEVLAQVLKLPLASWSYRNQPEVRHLGPVAQDFHGAFGLGEDDRTISTVDANGVALAAIQGLNAKLEAERDALAARVAALDGENAELRAESAELRDGQSRLATENAELRAELDRRDAEYRARLAAIEARLGGG